MLDLLFLSHRTLAYSSMAFWSLVSIGSLLTIFGFRPNILDTETLGLVTLDTVTLGGSAFGVALCLIWVKLSEVRRGFGGFLEVLGMLLFALGELAFFGVLTHTVSDDLELPSVFLAGGFLLSFSRPRPAIEPPSKLQTVTARCVVLVASFLWRLKSKAQSARLGPKQ